MPPAALLGLLVLAAAVSLAEAITDVAVLLIVVLAQALLARGWSQLPVPAAVGAAKLAFTGAVLADLAIFLDRAEPALAVLGVVGVGVVCALILQLIRSEGRPELTASVAAAVAALFVAASGAAWVGAAVRDDGAAARLGVLLIAAYAVGGLLPVLAHRVGRVPPAVLPRVRLALAAGAGALVGLLAETLHLTDAGAGEALVLGLVGAILVTSTDLLAVFAPNPLARACLGSTVPLLLSGPIVLGVLELSGR